MAPDAIAAAKAATTAIPIDLYAVYLDHRRCGDLNGDVEGAPPSERVWLDCIRQELTKSGRRREVPLNAESYAALVGASWVVMRGVSLKELQELLGHSSLAMTRRYAHLAPERLRSAVSRLEGLTAGDSTSSSAQASTQDARPAEEVLPNPAS